MTKYDLIEALEEAEERYLNHCYQPTVEPREQVYRRVIAEFFEAWLSAHEWACCRDTALTEAWREEMQP